MSIKRRGKKLLPFALILIFAVPSLAQNLLFKTGFEGTTQLCYNGSCAGVNANAVPSLGYSGSASIFLSFSGNDTSSDFYGNGTNSDWSAFKIYSWGQHPGIRVDSANTSGTYSNNFDDEIINSGCHSGSQCLKLKMYNYSNSICCPQQPIGETDLSGTPITDFYERFWIKYDPSWLTAINNFAGYNADSIVYWKSLDDYRIEPNIGTNNSNIVNGNYVLHSHFQADGGGIRGTDNQSGDYCPWYDPVTFAIINQGSTGNVCYTMYDSVDNTEYQLSIGSWHLVEYFFQRRDPVGRMGLAIDGHVISDANVLTYGPYAENIQDFGFLQMYDAPYPEIKYIDDWEIWDGIPCSNFPCQSATGSGGGPVTTPPPAVHLPQTSYNGVVCTVGTPCSWQMTTTPAASSFGTQGGSFPPGMSLNTSTGVVSGTPTSSGTFEMAMSAFNSSGKAVQYAYFNVDNTLQRPRIAYFWANGNTLNWITMGTGVSLSINNGIGPVSGPNGFMAVSAGTYTLTATNGAGSTSTTVRGASATATVTAGGTSPPSAPTGLTATVQ
jgi:hypothetical protein